MANMSEQDLGRYQRRAYIAGAVGVVVGVIGLLLNPTRFFQSYLFAYIFWLGIPIGSLGLLMLHHLTRGRWSFPVQRLLEAGVWTLPLMAVLFLPIIIGLDQIYPWAHANPGELYAEMTVHAVEEKHGYLNVPFFLIRAAVYFASWIVIGVLLCRWSARLDEETDLDAIRRMRRLSGPGAVVLFLTFSFAAVDWMMSLEPAWFSSIYGWMVLTGMGLEALVFVTLGLYVLRNSDPFDRLLEPQHYHDLGNLIFAFLILWTYMQVMQYIIIWSGNLPEEILWYMRRKSGGWAWVTGFLAIFHFFVPFALLLSQEMKRRPERLAAIAGGLLGMRLLAVYWMVAPAFPVDGIAVHWLDFVLVVALGGIWGGTYLLMLGRHAIVPRHDPRLERTLGYEPELTS